MKTSFAIGALIASLAAAAPAALNPRQAANIDTTILQFALTLEHLENAFYHGALNKFSQQDFMDAGYSATYYNNLKYISVDEQSHVQLLTSALQTAGVSPVAACTYNFPYTDVASFITLSSVLEGVGTSAYLAGAPLITSKAYLTVAGSILVTEALHTSMQRAAIGEVPMANPYGTPLDPMSVYTLAASFIVTCPASNAALPFQAFPGLTYDATAACTCEEPDCTPSQIIKRHDSTKTESAWTTWGSPTPTPASYCAPPSAGTSIKLTAKSPIPSGSFVTFVNGLNVASVHGSIDGADITVAIPAFAMGQTYVFVTKSDVETTFDDSAVLFGPAIVEVAPPAPVINDSIV